MDKNVKRFTFKELTPGMGSPKSAAVKIFTPNGRVKEALPPPPPPPPSFNEEQLKAAERDGYKKGFLDGVQDGRKQAENEQATNEKALLAMLSQFTKSVMPLFEDYRKLALQLKENMPKVAFAVARKVAGASLAENASAVINDIAVRCCESMASEPKLTITVHESLGDALEQRLQEVAARLPAATDIIIMRSGDMPAPDCRIEWKNGYMARSTDQILQQLQGVIEDMSNTAARDGAQELQQLHERMNETNNDKETR